MSPPRKQDGAQLLSTVRRLLEEMPAVELAVLFGSMARGKSGAESDVDVGLILQDHDLSERHRVEAELCRATGYSVDVVYLDEAPPLLRFQIARDGVLLVERRPYAWADFRARAMLDWWDWAPMARRLHDAAIRRVREKAADGQV